MKSSSLAYNRRETRDKRPLGRDRELVSSTHKCKAFLVAGRSPWIHGHRRQHTSVLPLTPWIHGLRPATKKALHLCVDDTSSCSDPYPTVACPEFHVGCRLG